MAPFYMSTACQVKPKIGVDHKNTMAMRPSMIHAEMPCVWCMVMVCLSSGEVREISSSAIRRLPLAFTHKLLALTTPYLLPLSM